MVEVSGNRKLKSGSKIEIWNMGRKLKFWSKIEIWVNKLKFWSKIEIWNWNLGLRLKCQRIEILAKNRNFSQKSKFCSSIEILAWIRNFSKISNFWGNNFKLWANGPPFVRVELGGKGSRAITDWTLISTITENGRNGGCHFSSISFG